jgi:dienelactone hydrolase
MKTVVKILAVLMAVSALAVAAIFGPYVLRVQHFQASAADGYHADFYLYVPSSISNGEQATILVQPNNSGTNSDDPDVHRKDAWWTGFERKSIADELGVILLVPAFIRPGTDWQIYTHALDRDSLITEREDIKRIDLQLLAMLHRARVELADQGIQTDEKIFIQGFSASAMFANRFTMLHPDRVKAATIGSPGGWPIAPVDSFQGHELNYPAGIADLESLTGTSFDFAAYNAVPQLIYMGSADDNDSLDFTDGWDEADAKVVDMLFGADPLSRWDDAKAIYLESGANVEFLLIDDIGHDRKALQTYSTEFFKKILNQ